MKKVLLIILLFVFAGNISFGQNSKDKTLKAERLLKTYFSSALFHDALLSNYGVKPFEFRIRNRSFFNSFCSEVIGEFKIDSFSFDSLHVYAFNEISLNKLELNLTNTNYTEKKGIPLANKGPGDPCTNMDFETGDFTGWEMFEGSVNANPYEMVGATQIMTPGASHTIMNPGVDAIVGIPTTNPNGGNFSVMLGDYTGFNNGAASMRQTFLVSAANAVFTYSYALVMEDPSGHTNGEKPFFKVNMFDQNGDTISCGDYSVISGPANSGGDPDFVAYGNPAIGYYLPWRTTFAPLDNYIGQNVTIEFIIGDCSQGGHYGYGYIDAECSPLEIVTSSPSICDGNPIVLTAPPGASSYLWSTGETTQTINTTVAGNYNVEITPVTGAGCAITLSITVPGSPGLPTAIFDMLPNPICDGESFTVTDNSTATNGSVIDYWEWDFGDGTNISGSQNETYTYGTSGTYNVQLVAGSGGCYDTLIQPIVVNAIPDPTVTGVGPYCAVEAAVTLSAVDAGGTWSSACGTCVNATSGVFDPTTAGVGFHDVTYSFGAPCPVDNTITIEIFLNHDASIAAAGPFCENEGVQSLNVLEAGGVYSATCGTCIDASTGGFNPATAGAGIHTVTYTFANPCGDVQTIDIVVNPIPNPTVTGVGPYCSNDAAVTLSAVDAGGTWSATCGTCINATSGSFNPATAGAGLHDVTYSIGGSCPADNSIAIEVNQTRDASIAAVGPFCANAGIQAINVIEAGGLYSATCGTCINSATGNFNPTIAGVGTHTITYSLGNPCGDIQSIDVDVNPAMNASITPVGPLCLNSGPINLDAVDVGGLWTGSGITNINLGTFDPSVAGAGTHIITYEVAGMCGDIQTTTIEVYPALALQAFPGSAICLGESVNVSALASGGDGNYFYSWDNNGGNLQTANVSPTVTTTYTVTVTDGCESVSGIVTVTVNPLPDVNFTGNPLQGCLPLSVDFTDIGQPAGNQCLWSFGDGEVSANCAPVSNTYTEPGCFDVTLTVISPEGCTSTNTLVDYVCAYENPIADFTFGPQPTDYTDTDIEFTNESTDNAVTFDWQFGENGYLGTDISENPSFYFPGGEPGTYEVCLDVSTVNGCVDDTCQYVVIDDVFIIYVPNAFTPDGDGINDEFSVVIDGYDVETFELLVFDRWGLLIWSTESPNEKWAGSVNGVPNAAVQDAYVWKVKVKDTKGKLYAKIGHVLLLK